MSTAVPSSLIGSKRPDTRPTTPGARSTHVLWAFYIIPNFTDTPTREISSIFSKATGCSLFQIKPSCYLTIPPFRKPLQCPGDTTTPLWAKRCLHPPECGLQGHFSARVLSGFLSFHGKGTQNTILAANLWLRNACESWISHSFQNMQTLL